MPKKSTYSMDITKMKSLLEGLKKKASIQVGVFESETARKDGALTNASLAMIHEMGSPEHNLPARSMLKIPISDHISQVMEPMKGHAEAFLAHSTLVNLYKTIGIAAEKVVAQAFASGGFGKWPSLTYKTLMGKLRGSLKTRKGKLAKIYAGQVGQGILINSGQLRRAFSSRVRMKF